jgi:hypothetical protein
MCQTYSFAPAGSRTRHLKPRWLVEVSIAWAMRAAGL